MRGPTLGVTSCGMQVMTLPPGWEGYPDHVHDGTVEDANQEEVYIPLHGSATLIAGEERHELRPGVMIRVGPEQRRRIVPGEGGIRLSHWAAFRAPSRRRRGPSSAARRRCREADIRGRGRQPDAGPRRAVTSARSSS